MNKPYPLDTTSDTPDQIGNTKLPIGVVDALRNFVDSIEEYDRSGVWPDNATLRRLADEGREALNFRTD